MPEQAPAAPAAAPNAEREVLSASDYLERSDEEIEAAIQRPGAAVAGRRGAADPTAKAPEPEPVAAEPETPAVDAVAEAEQAEAAEPEPEAAPAEPPKLLTTFSVSDAEGELEIPTELRFSFKANGQDYTDVPLDKVVKMAQMGYYNQDREDQVLAAKQFVTEAQTEVTRLREQIQEYDRQVDRLLTDDAFASRAKSLYAEQHSPEARAVRAEQQTRRLQAEQAQAQMGAQIAAFTHGFLVPEFGQIVEAAPTVSETELLGHFTRLIAPLLVNGQVPPQRFGQVQRLVSTDLRNWAEAQHESRATKHAADTKAAQAAQREVALAKRSVARKTAPPAASAPAAPKSKKYTSATEWLDSALPVAED